jgi:hypothetical protein
VKKVWEQQTFTTKTRPCHCGLAIYIKKYLKAKEEELMETQIFHQAKIYNLQKNLQKKPKSFKIL